MDRLVIVRGAGDLATGVIAKLWRSGFTVVALESEAPSAIRRTVAFSEAVYQKETTVEGITACLAVEKNTLDILEQGKIPILIDKEADILKKIHPFVLVDAILAKRNIGTDMEMADIVIGLGPGFTAGVDVHAVVETMRGHNLGRVYYKGSAIPNTGIPGMVGGYAKERVMYAGNAGIMKGICRIGDSVQAGDIIAYVGNEPVYASISGVLRGILPDGFEVRIHEKLADIDPREDEYQNCFLISDKARCIAGGVLEAILCLEKGRLA